MNPITYTERVVGNFLRYQLSAYPFADPGLHGQMRTLLSLEETRETPLLKGPFISLSRSFRTGAAVKEMVEGGLLHPFMPNLVAWPHLYGHQEKAIRAIAAGRHVLVSTGTGSGKTETFLYPLISRCLELRDQKAPEALVAVLVYPMNALAEDQLLRLRGLLAGTGISFGMYVGRTPERRADVTGKRLRAGSSRQDYLAAFDRAQKERSGAVHPAEERVSREEMRDPATRPRILLTNVKQLELLLTRQKDVEIFDGARLDYLIFDEAHTYGGATGAETACLIRRLRAWCGRGPDDTVCIGTSATLADPDGGEKAAQDFACRFFGVKGDDVVLVGEEYEKDDWISPRETPPPPQGDPGAHLRQVLESLDGDQTGLRLAEAFRGLTGWWLEPGADWPLTLHARLSRNELCFALSELLDRPRPLTWLVEALEQRLGRPVCEEEVLAWLALGAAARQEGRPLLRPVVHAFVRGVERAVVTFPEGEPAPRLWLSAEQERQEGQDPLFPYPVLTCTTCGQHYFVHHLSDFSLTARGFGGGQATADRTFWPALEESQGGSRVLLFDHLVSEDEDDDEPGGWQELHLCRWCGAAHPDRPQRCDGCGREAATVVLRAVPSREATVGQLARCLSCGAQGRRQGGRYREPARPVRAITVSDVHILAQNMLQEAERRRLLVFTDNRQDAAFQAGWMRDRARRFRLRELVWSRLRQGRISLGDLLARLDQTLDQDDALSQALLPEVWQETRKQASPVQHADNRKYFLRNQLLREITTPLKQQTGLEPWGRLRVEYEGLVPELSFIQEWSTRLAHSPQVLAEGFAALLDVFRRRMFVLDREGRIFSRIWEEGSREVQRGYLPLLKGVPKGLKLQRDPSDDPRWVAQWVGERGDTLVRQAARRWGVPDDQVNEFIAGLWDLVSEDLGLLATVTLTGSRDKNLPGCAGVRQLDADLMRLTPHTGRWRCQTCRRVQTRPTPNNACLAWRCPGRLQFEPEDRDNYEILALDGRFAMLAAAEHSAQVRAEERERLERLFKSEGETVNTLVCTPTLEMGVDIGALDTVLLRNVPPLPSNYWQRVGRAGRRHRIAVNITYARPVGHDRAWFADPLKFLAGRVEPPRFNMRNELMLARHVHAAVLSRLHGLARTRPELQETLRTLFPGRIREYLFDTHGNVLPQPLDVSPLQEAILAHREDLLAHLRAALAEVWPAEDAAIATPERLEALLLDTTQALRGVLAALKKRLDWALRQQDRLEAVRQAKGALDEDDDALYRRCNRLVKKLKGTLTRRRQEAEGYDDTNTFGVLASEGFLPGYGLEIGSIVGTALMPRVGSGGRDFDLPRPPAVALREYVPGNLIYANGHRFTPRTFHLEALEPTLYAVDVSHEAVAEQGTPTPQALEALGSMRLEAVPCCDADLQHLSYITDDEEYRFQLPVAVYGYEMDRHAGGAGHRWGERDLLFRRGVHLRLVNVGAGSEVAQGRLGYPVCRVCGQSRSPFSSERELEHFQKSHQERCGRVPERLGFFASVVADVLSLPSCPDRTEAFTLAEVLRIGMSRVLEMEREDLEVLVVGRSGVDEVDALLYDPMPGGSGLLEQALARWSEVVEAARQVAAECPSACLTSCVDCLQTFRNQFYHKHLDRTVALERFGQWGSLLEKAHDLPARLPQSAPKEGHMPVNVAEARLRSMLLKAGFPEPEWQKSIHLGRPLGSTTPDAYYEEDDRICIYLDGLSQHLHGNPETAKRDREIRTELKNKDYLVLEIAASDLDDRAAMTRHFYQLAIYLLGKPDARRIRDDQGWFEGGDAPSDRQDGRPAGGLDLDLFQDWLHPALQILVNRVFEVRPGGDVLAGERVVGSYLAEVRRNNKRVRLLDGQGNDLQALEAELNGQGFDTLTVTPDTIDSLVDQEDVWP